MLPRWIGVPLEVNSHVIFFQNFRTIFKGRPPPPKFKDLTQNRVFLVKTFCQINASSCYFLCITKQIKVGIKWLKQYYFIKGISNHQKYLVKLLVFVKNTVKLVLLTASISRDFLYEASRTHLVLMNAKKEDISQNIVQVV